MTARRGGGGSARGAAGWQLLRSRAVPSCAAAQAGAALSSLSISLSLKRVRLPHCRSVWPQRRRVRLRRRRVVALLRPVMPGTAAVMAMARAAAEPARAAGSAGACGCCPGACGRQRRRVRPGAATAAEPAGWSRCSASGCGTAAAGAEATLHPRTRPLTPGAGPPDTAVCPARLDPRPASPCATRRAGRQVGAGPGTRAAGRGAPRAGSTDAAYGLGALEWPRLRRPGIGPARLGQPRREENSE